VLQFCMYVLAERFRGGESMEEEEGCLFVVLHDSPSSMGRA
jgi:hypothetical protein